jgi:multidrug resistance efflux pump
MDILILGIYSFFVWLIFIKLKWLPWNITSQVIVVIIPIVGMAILILSLNVFAPSSSDVRVFKYTVPIVSQVRGRVIEVPVEEGNRLVKKGDVLFRVDPTPYQLDVNVLEAQLANAIGGQREQEESLKGSRGKVAEARGAMQQANSNVSAATANFELARKRVQQYRELVRTGAGSRFDLEKAETDLRAQQGALDAARSQQAQARGAETQALAGEQQVIQRLGAKSNGEYAQVAQIRAQLENAKWQLAETTTRSPCDCYVVNLALRVGGFVAGLPLNPVMTLVEADGQIVAFFGQNELHQVAPGNEAEFAMNTVPGKVIKGKVDSIIWAQGQAQITASGTLPSTGFMAPPPGRYAVKFDIAERDREVFLAAGANGDAAIYTDHGHHIHILRKVLIRVTAWMDYLVLKLH